MPDSYDTADGIAQQLLNLTDFNKLLDNRREAHKRGEKLTSWVVFGRLLIDEYGQALPVEEGPADPDKVPKVVELKPFIREHCKDGRISWSHSSRRGVPPVEVLCTVCGKGWTIEDWFMARADYDYQAEKFNYTHSACKQNKREADNKAFFEEALAKAGYKDYLMANTANEYHGHGGCEHCLSWFLVKMPFGQLKMGWRKRVVELTWVDCVMRHQPDFSNEDVTQGHRMIHAWGMEKLVEYLKAIKDCV